MDSGKVLFLKLTYMIFHQRGAPAAGGERLLILPFYEVAETVNCTAECACFFCCAAAKFQDEVKKQDQSGILAQKFFFCGNLLGWNFSAMLIHLLNSSPCQVPR